MEIGYVEALATRPPGARTPMAAEGVLALAGLGLDGDRHADPLSPRQVLLASAAVYADFTLPAYALGENLLVDFETAALASGTVLRIGTDVLLRLMFQCEACGYLDASQAGLSGRIGWRRGVLARVLAGGTIRPGDRILDLGRPLPAWDEDWRARVTQVLHKLPDGMVLTYAQLARLAGVQSTYCRAFPRLLGKLGLAGKALSAQAAAGRRCWQGEGLFDEASHSACSW
ncbi:MULTISPECIES: MOSC domain-containing protein [unclassified Massilia]|uniref:MOSC domain-containing protein n=1 Tax=unclassified Massilia TaxID=2609279 RepID=UPI000A89DCAD|nr:MULTISPECIES: MOSC domain-containing protein [unclassified Massilia]